MRRAAILLFLLILGVSAREAWLVFGPEQKKPSWERFLAFAPKARVWTDATGRSIEAVPISADERTVWLRVLATQTLHAVPLDRLSEEDRDFVARWRKKPSSGYSLDPAPPDRWPSEYSGATVTAAVEQGGAAGGAQIWRTSHYELRDRAGLDPETVQVLARICESVDGAARAVPLPLLWGRSEMGRRMVSIYPDEASYRAAGALPGSLGTFIPSTGAVLIYGPSLAEEDLLGRVRGFSLEKRQRYHVLVHELVHQATIGIILADFPAWVSEGLAEYFAAIQRTPGRFQFHNSHLSAKRHIVDSFGYDGVVELESYPLWSLDQFLGRGIEEWNRISATDRRDGHTWIQYAQALLLVEYFGKGDSPGGTRFRSYLEAVLTGADQTEAARIHLLAGRSHAELERAMADYWRTRGMVLDFSPSPSAAEAEARLGIGLENRFGR